MSLPTHGSTLLRTGPASTADLEGSVTLSLTPNAGMLYGYVVNSDLRTFIYPSAGFDFTEGGGGGGSTQYSITGGVTLLLTPSASLSYVFTPPESLELVVHFPGFFVVKKTSGTSNSVSETKEALASITGANYALAINDLWMRFFDQSTVPDGSINDRMFYWLKHVRGVQGDSLPVLLKNWDGRLGDQ